MAALAVLSSAATGLSAPASAVCYADPVRLKAAIGIVVGSYKCPGFKAALTGKAHTLFMSRGGLIDQMTGSCQREISALVDEWSFAAVKDKNAFCARIEASFSTDAALVSAARDAGVR